LITDAQHLQEIADILPRCPHLHSLIICGDLLMAFLFGGTVVIESSFLYLFEIIDLIIREKVTGFPIVPTITALLLKLKNLESYDFSSLRYITNTAQAIPLYISELRQIFPRTKFYSMYGLTECKRVSSLPPEEFDRRPTSVGIAMPNTEVYWLGRFLKEGEEGMKNRSRRPSNSPFKTDDAVEQAVLRVRGRHPAWGGRKIR
jgi:acyl-CoA synthetase (AMP-forming)/AMP-acid ligase II